MQNPLQPHPTLISPTTYTQHRTPTTTLTAGRSHKPFTFDTHKLMACSPYWRNLLTETPEPTAEQTTFEDLDESAVGLFAGYLQHGRSLQRMKGPSDFHSCGHWIGLYVVALRWGVGGLDDEVMDHIRAYYASADMSASPYRLEYIYAYTSQPNLMRTFLVETAAWRVLNEGSSTTPSGATGELGERGGVSPALFEVLEKGGRELREDFVRALVKFGRDEGQEAEDPRRGLRRDWHVGVERGDEGEMLEPWEK
ncbi:hypothetical protein BAUCODRAFT_126461 [Baudoinia panamericana UAMH 10762]|uniref:BTB domain-containing protein n=1 Tax=Baudoinia panamericana (strain UAMH 10762) TaxID=717646 RepID=M2N0N7_BAUPA|nr:uncharacterized protein BAUCODRAFT_126461 [Baudoinia panamericana UAMH 10762]EMC92479.1 hypothetical protein BAUCODRAFT_126461 [Baudoinia panamericana UAMH 10762]